MDNLKIGHKIKKLRELKNLTQEHMANSIGITQGAYSRMELGETEITYSKLEKISEELGMKPEDVIAFNESVVFNVMNNQTGNGLVINNSQLSDTEKNLFEQQIILLKEENAHLKKVIESLLSK
ncbi:MAG: helix-turn-helix transcriptional regulator [Crocinitomicaceae bacterium]|jgi:transcriptional regulator with XRE-family HTH domain|nr:helix-turn-helix transcriptional regulator [Crocinitomicaceae bacterium]